MRGAHFTLVGPGHASAGRAYLSSKGRMTMDSKSAEASEIPIACNLQVFSTEERGEHLALGMEVLFRLPTRMEELPDGFLFRYEGNEDLFLRIARFARNEHRCCPWAAFTVEMEPFAEGGAGAIRLRYIGGARGKPMLAEAIKKLGEAASDPQVYARLEKACGEFGRISADNKKTFYERLKACC
jgi:hypothetical protein